LKKYEKGQQQKSIKPELNDLNGKLNKMLCSFELMAPLRRLNFFRIAKYGFGCLIKPFSSQLNYKINFRT
jgi:hypothetical protein